MALESHIFEARAGDFVFPGDDTFEVARTEDYAYLLSVFLVNVRVNAICGGSS